MVTERNQLQQLLTIGFHLHKILKKAKLKGQKQSSGCQAGEAEGMD